jgi:hypothetical protein
MSNSKRLPSRRQPGLFWLALDNIARAGRALAFWRRDKRKRSAALAVTEAPDRASFSGTVGWKSPAERDNVGRG